MTCVRLRNDQREGRAAFGAVGDGRPAAVGRGDPLDDRQAQAGAAAFGGEEWLEQPVEQRRRDARPAVGDLDFQPGRRVGRR